MYKEFDREKIASQYGFLGLTLGLGIHAIFYAIGAAIFSLFVKKNPPITFN